MVARLRRIRFTRQLLLLQIGLLVLVLGVGFGLVAWLLERTLEHQYEQRALSVARTVAADNRLAGLIRKKDSAAVQQIALADASATGALFVVVTDANGIRLAHPTPDLIGKPVSTDPSGPLSGREVANIERGTLGLSARGKVPAKDASGAVVGEVSVGFDAAEIQNAMLGLLGLTSVFAVGALLVGVAGSSWLARMLKRRTLGLEPADLTDLMREREAVLHGISEGVLAVDTQHRVTMCNDEAIRLLDRPVRPGMAVAELDLPPRLRALIDEDEAEPVLAVTGKRILVANRRPVHRDGSNLGSVLTLRDRTDVEQLTSELDAVRSLTAALRAQRHEFANRMHTVLGLLNTGAYADAVEYLSAVTQFHEVDSIGESPALKSATIRAFMAAKTARAAELGVSLTLSETSWVRRKLVAPVEVITVLANLVDNALDAAHASTHRPARVEVDLLSDGTRLVISVANTGDGISPAQAETIFMEGVSTRGSDRGYGLAITRQTAKVLGGDVVLANPGLDGTETVFVAELPAALAENEED
ncbi:MAG TPA: sensor histidine kinase [Kribbella sp.]|nr:sensor histidine kinase [Kribbella sp.]